MRAPSSLPRKRNKPRRRLPNRRLTTTGLEAMGGRLTLSPRFLMPADGGFATIAGGPASGKKFKRSVPMDLMALRWRENTPSPCGFFRPQAIVCADEIRDHATRIFLLILPSTTCARSAGVRGRVEKLGALGCGDADKSRQAFEAAVIDRQSVVFGLAYQTQV